MLLSVVTFIDQNEPSITAVTLDQQSSRLTVFEQPSEPVLVRTLHLSSVGARSDKVQISELGSISTGISSCDQFLVQGGEKDD